MGIMQIFMHPNAWLALITLVFLEIVLGIDNIVFLSIISSKLPEKEQPKARITGLLLAMFARIGLVFAISLLMQLTKPLFTFNTKWIDGAVTGQSLIILAGGLFLIYKSVSEIHEKFEIHENSRLLTPKRNSFFGIIIQIVVLDIIFSLDSVLTAVGMVSFKEFGYGGAMMIIVIAIVISITMMIFFSGSISRFVNNHPTIQMLALSFLILIGVMLIIESAHLARLNLFGTEVGEIPKGYIYFAIAFSLMVEFLNMKLKKKSESSKVK